MVCYNAPDMKRSIFFVRNGVIVGFGITLLITFQTSLLGTVLAFPVWLAMTSRTAAIYFVASWTLAFALERAGCCLVPAFGRRSCGAAKVWYRKGDTWR